MSTILKKKIGIILAGYLLFLIPFIYAVNIGVSPATIKFKNVLREGYSERSVMVSVDGTDPIGMEFQPRGDIAEWLNFSEKNFTVSKDSPYVFKVSVTPPGDMPNGDYEGFLRITTSSFGSGVEGHAVGKVRSALDLRINVEVTDVEVLGCSVKGYSVESVEKGDDIVFNLEVSNNGNVRLRPTILVDIWDSDQISVLKSEEFLEGEILPTTSQEISLRVDSDDLDFGQYWVDISVVECYSSGFLTFDVLEPGALRAEGVLLGIVTKKSVEVGETAPILVTFKNTGEKEVEAQFRGKVSLGGRIVQVLESERFRVPVSKINDFSFYFTPRNPGRYAISGRVFYSGKKTFESSTVLEAISKESRLRTLLVFFVYAFLIFLITSLFYKIRKERKLLNLKLRRLKNLE